MNNLPGHTSQRPSMATSTPPKPSAGPSKKKTARPPTSTSDLGGGGYGASGGLQSPPDPPVDLSKVRAFAACRNCRTKKIKCLPNPSSHPSSIDAGNPPGPCQQCSQAGLECTYPPTRDRAAYSRQYVQNLESRVQALEMVNQRMLPMLEAFEGGGDVAHALIGLGTGSVAATPYDLKPSHGALDDDGSEDEEEGEMEDMGQMTQDERGNYRWIGSSNALNLLDRFSIDQPTPTAGDPISTDAPRELKHRDSNPYFGPVAGSGVVKALPGIDEVVYPTLQAANEMVDAFFAEVHPCLPVVVEWQFREAMAKVMDRRARGEPEVETGSFLSVLFAVFALGERVLVCTRAWHRERAKLAKGEAVKDEETILPGEAEAGVIWYERAQILHFTTIKDVNLHQVQCLTLMAAFQAGVNAMPMSWLLAGQAMRVAQDLGLHRYTGHAKIPFVEKQIRARCWWAIYGLERTVAISLGRPLGCDDLDIDVAYPAVVDDAALYRIEREGIATSPAFIEKWEEPDASVMSGFVALTKLCKIAGRVAHLLYRPSNGRNVADPTWAQSQQHTINKLDKMIRDWLANEVPSKYKDPSQSRPVQLVSAVLSNTYFAVLLRLHRNFLPPNPDFPRPKPPPSSLSLSHCVDAARSVIHIAAQSRVLVPPSHHLAVFCQYLWSSAVILLLCEVQAHDQIIVAAVGTQVEACRKSLQALEPVWPGCRKLKLLLTDVEKRTKEVIVHSRHASPRPARKRKPSTEHRKRSMGPPTLNGSRGTQSKGDRSSSADSSSWQTPPIAGGNMDKRPRLATHDSDTISLGREEFNPSPYAASQASLLMGTPQTNTIRPLDLFDIGGVTFDGLEMLQGFGGTDVASMWTSLAENNWVQTPQSSTNPQAGFEFNQGQGNGTPGSNSGPSPGQQWQFNPQSAPPPGQTTPGAGPAPAGLGFDSGEFWSQVAGGSFDWQADPNVPFNI